MLADTNTMYCLMIIVVARDSRVRTADHHCRAERADNLLSSAERAGTAECDYV